MRRFSSEHSVGEIIYAADSLVARDYTCYFMQRATSYLLTDKGREAARYGMDGYLKKLERRRRWHVYKEGILVTGAVATIISLLLLLTR